METIKFRKVLGILVLAPSLMAVVGCESGSGTVPATPASSLPAAQAPPPAQTQPPAQSKPPAQPPAQTQPPTSAVGTATISWQASLQRVSGAIVQPLEIKGYNVYYGTSPTSLGKTIRLATQDTVYTIKNLPVNTYYVAVTALDSKGVESGYSNVVTRVVK